MEAYFDNSATTRVSDRVLDIVVKTMREDYGNPSAKHRMGVKAERYVKEAAAKIAKTLKVQEKEILFTSGGTESDNLALIGCALANERRGKHLITTSVEHPAVYQPLCFLESLGFEITILPVDGDGHISIEELKAAVRKDTTLVSVMYVNNEVGAVEPIAEIAAAIHEKNPDTLLHVDAIQGYGKFRIYPKREGIDLLAVSGHKLHAPKGVGFLYIDSRVKIRPILFGGGQQKGMRSGTINVPGIAGLGEASVEAYENFDGKIAGAIGRGFCVLIGVSEEDTKETADLMVRKMLGLRIFQDENEKTNLSLADVGGSLLLISQFTLYADCRKGNRPSFVKAGSPDKANELYEYIIEKCRESGRPVERGVFGAYMKISLVNDGPFTVMLDSEDLKRPKAGAGGR